MSVTNREQWGSKIGFILAAAGSAIGLGNIWRFPYVMGERGGAAFIIVFLICIAIIGIPVLIAEILMGRATNRNPVGAYKQLRNRPLWGFIGGIGVLTGFIILSFYAVVAGWTFGYVIEAVRGKFETFTSPEMSEQHFSSLLGNVSWVIGFLALFVLLTMYIVYSGVNKGIERGTKVMMPVLFVLLIVLMIKGLTLTGSSKGLEFLFRPDWSKITPETVLVALGQAFFTMSLGMGVMITYGSYMPKQNSIPGAAIKIVLLDTLISLIAGVAIFTSLTAFGIDPETNEVSGPGLIFHVLPVIFTKMAGGYIFAILFFVLLSIAALTSTISLLEVLVAYFVDELKWQRKKAVLVCGTFAFSIGVPCALSFNILQNVTLKGKTFFDLMEFTSANILLPVGGFFIAIFVAWVWTFKKADKELKSGAENLFKRNYWLIAIWKFFLRYISPVLILIVFLHSVGILDFILHKILLIANSLMN